VLEAVRRAGVGHVVLASSSSVYGASPELPKHEGLRTAPLSPYAVSTLATEAYAVAYAHCYGLAVVPAFVDAALAGWPVPLHGDGSQTRDFTFVGSVTDVLVRAVTDRVSSPEPVNLAFGSRTSLRELLALLEQVLGRPVAVQQHPLREGDVPHSQADSTRLRTLFGDLQPVPLEDGVRATVEWFEHELEPAQA